MNDLHNQWALVTGASSGFGKDFAHLLAERGADLVLVARRTELLTELADELRRIYGVQVHIESRDLAVPGVGAALKAALDAAGINIEILVNNAGYGLFGEFLQQPLPKLLDMLQLNILTLTELTHLFAADMVHRGHGGILLVASLGGYQSTPLYAAYCASKGYVLQFGEALHEELKPRGVTVTVVSPGISATQFLSVSGQQPTLYQRIAMMQSRPVAKIGLAALASGRASIVPGWLNTLSAWAFRMAPRAVVRKVTHQLMKN